MSIQKTVSDLKNIFNDNSSRMEESESVIITSDDFKQEFGEFDESEIQQINQELVKDDLFLEVVEAATYIQNIRYLIGLDNKDRIPGSFKKKIKTITPQNIALDIKNNYNLSKQDMSDLYSASVIIDKVWVNQNYGALNELQIQQINQALVKDGLFLDVNNGEYVVLSIDYLIELDKEHQPVQYPEPQLSDDSEITPA